MATQPKERDEDDEIFEFEDDEIEIVDDTPEEDRGREPMPKEVVDEFENDDLEEYSGKVKTRLKQAKKLWNDERREKERAQREHNEAMATAKQLFEENKRLKSTLSQGEGTLLNSFKQGAEFEEREAQRLYREAYEAGDADKLLEAQKALQKAVIKQHELDNYKPSSFEDETEVEVQQSQAQPPRPDAKTMAWQERNEWYGSDDEMTATALGLHAKLVKQKGAEYAGSDDYWQTIDTTMRRRFPEHFGEERAPAKSARAASVVAPATRNRTPKRVSLTKSQVAVAKKLGLTNEQYARELVKLENDSE